VTYHHVKILFGVCLILNLLFWMLFRHTQAEWANVPPVPSDKVASAFGLGDEQFAYRNIALMLQNLGDSGGRSTPLHDYDYDALSDWFLLESRLDSRSNMVPYLAAYYFSAVQNPDMLPPLIRYLETIGAGGVDHKWRWLAQAVFLAHYRLQDPEWALELSGKLSALQLKGVDLPVWAKNMNVMLMNASGEKEAALEIMLQTLETEQANMDPQEMLFLIDYICFQILDPAQASMNPLCKQLENQ